MAKLFTSTLLAASLCVSAGAFAEDAKVFSFNVGEEAVGKELAFNISAVDGAEISVDWGDGNLVKSTIADYDGEGWVFTELKGTLAGTTVTVYTPEGVKINYLDLNSDLQDDPEAKITALEIVALPDVKELSLSKNLVKTLDISGCEAITKLEATNNLLTKLTFGAANSSLATVDVSNSYNITTGEKNADCGDNQVLGSKWNLLPALKTLNVTGNLSSKLGWFDTFSVASNKELVTLTINCCGISTIDLTQQTALKTLNAQWNKLTTIDLSQMVAKSSTVFLAHNNLKSLQLPDTESAKMTRVNVAYNELTFATLPQAGMTSNANNYVYTPQADVVTPLSGHNTVDFTSLAKVGDTPSVFTWTAILDGAEEATELSEEHYEYSDNDGVFRFFLPVKNLQASITNEALPALTLTSTPATSVGLLPVLVAMEMKEASGTLQFGLNSSVGQLVFVDWGDGEFEGPVTVEQLAYGYTPDFITGEVKGQIVTVKGEPSTIESFYAPAETSFAGDAPAVTTAQIEAIDLSALTAIKKLNLDYHALTALDLKANTELLNVSAVGNALTAFDAELPNLTDLDLSNSGSNGVKTLGQNAPAIALANLPALTKLTANYTGIAPDLSNAPKLTTAILQGNGYTDYAPASSTVTALTLNFNNYETFDASGLTASGKINVFLTYNKLGSHEECMILPENINNLNIANNNFSFATLPALDAVGGTLTYAPQRALDVAADGSKVDLSAQAEINGTATEFVWKLDGATVEDGILAENGVFDFKNSGDYTCSMTNAAYPKLTLTTVPVSVVGSGVEEIMATDANAPVEFFNLQGIKVSGNEPGIYVRRQGTKATKVIVK